MGDVAAEPAADVAAMVELTLCVNSDTLVVPEDVVVLGRLLLVDEEVAFMVDLALYVLVVPALNIELGAELDAEGEPKLVSVDRLDIDVLETTNELLWLAKKLLEFEGFPLMLEVVLEP